ALAVVSVAWSQVRVGGPSETQDPAYPLRVRIITRNTSRGGYGGMRMRGRGDLFGQQEQGFDYASTCDELLMVTHGDDRYSAKWKKQDKELEMLVSKIGSGKADKCSVKTDVHPFIYEVERGAVVTKPIPN